MRPNASNVLASEDLLRLGLAADLVAFLADAAVAVLLYVLLLPVSRTVSLMAAAAAGYLTETFTYFVAPGLAPFGARLVGVTASVAEVSLCLYLIVKGVRAPGGGGGRPAEAQ